MPTLNTLAQIGILLFGASAIWVVGRPEPWRKWGYLLGLCGQPFWFYITATKAQWGIFALSLWYTYSWGQGAYHHLWKARA